MFRRRNASKSNDEFYTWKNPDGSDGGQVSRHAKIDPSATIEKFASVTASGVVGPGEVIKNGDLICVLGNVRLDPIRIIKRSSNLTSGPK